MKRFQRIFLSLLAIFAVGFSMANAYTFEVRNRSPFGILNLKTLNLKPDTTHTGIILDGANYVIKIDPNHESTGAIRVDAICDESGVNCKKVSELGLGGGSSITIKGDPDNFCYRQDETTLVCNNTALRELIESWGLGGSIKIDGKDGEYCYRKKEDNVLFCDNNSLPSGNGNANNPKITIYQGGVEKGSFTLNQSSNTGIYLDAGGDGNANNPTITIRQGGVTKGSFTLNQASNKTIDLDAGGSGNANNPKITIYQGGVEKGSFTLNQVSDKNINLTDADTWKPNIRGQDGYVSGTTMSTVGLCWKTDTNGNPGRRSCGGGSSDSGVWEIGNVTNANQTVYNVIKPISNYISNNMYISGNIYHDGYVSILPLGTKATYRMNDIYITDYGVSIGEMANKTAGLGVHGPITVGKYMTQTTSRPGGGCTAGTERNTISIYASGAAGNDNFEILGSPRILVGVKNGGYLYFDDNNKLGINTTSFNSSSTLTVNGPVKIGNDCSNRGCSEANKGEIRYFESNNVGHFVGCTKTSGGYQRRDLTIGTTQTTIASNNNCNTYNTPYNSSIYSQTIAQQTVCD